MPTKKTAAKRKEPEPQGPQVEGFKVVDYEGLDLLVCETCGFDTFDVGSAKAHITGHDRADAVAAELADITEHLAERAQVQTEGDA